MSYDIDEFEELMESSRMGGWNMRSLRVCRSLPTSPLNSPKQPTQDADITKHEDIVVENHFINDETQEAATYPNLLLPPDPFQEIQAQTNGSAGVRPKTFQVATESDQTSSLASGGMRRTQSCRRPTGNKKDITPFSYRQRAHANAWKRQHVNSTSMEEDETENIPPQETVRFEPEPPPTQVADDDDDLQDCKIYRLRSFRTTSGGIENRGDSFKVKSRRQSSKRRTPHTPHRRMSGDVSSSRDEVTAGSPLRNEHFDPDSNTSSPARPTMLNVRSSPMSEVPYHDRLHSIIPEEQDPHEATVRVSGGGSFSAGPSVQMDHQDMEEEDNTVYKVLVIGSQGVGKSTLTRQLLTSEYLANSDRYLDDDREQVKIVSVMLDDEESMVQFADVRNFEGAKSTQDVDAYIIVYSVTDQNSFAYAHACLQDLTRKGAPSRKKVIIVVANKQDNIRNRQVSEHEGQSLASHRNCKYTEVSALLDHKVDELLVGIIRQIRLKQHLLASTKSSGEPRRIGCLQRAALGLFRRFFRKRTSSANCENLLSP